MLRHLDGYKSSNTDLTKLQESITAALCKFIDEAGKYAARENIRRAVFVDAGFKDGKARIGIVRLDGDDVLAVRKNITAPDIHEAEWIAINEGYSLAQQMGNDVPVYSDSQSAVDRAKQTLETVSLGGGVRVHWLSRKQNKHADHMANMRGQ